MSISVDLSNLLLLKVMSLSLPLPMSSTWYYNLKFKTEVNATYFISLSVSLSLQTPTETAQAIVGLCFPLQPGGTVNVRSMETLWACPFTTTQLCVWRQKKKNSATDFFLVSDSSRPNEPPLLAQLLRFFKQDSIWCRPFLPLSTCFWKFKWTCDLTAPMFL